ncbi:30S ribosomal protein S18 [bacterium]|nr:30S ribosomal protein S18 [bacterium]
MSRNKLKISSRLLKKKVRKQAYLNPKHCRFCGNKDLELSLDYKNINLLRNFLTERSKILPSRVSGNCSFHQRALSQEIKTARAIALLPFCALQG